jgi:hypothetical protein
MKCEDVKPEQFGKRNPENCQQKWNEVKKVPSLIYTLLTRPDVQIKEWAYQIRERV